MAIIEGTTIPNDKTVGKVGDVYVNTISGMSYELIYIGTITYKEGSDKIYDWRPIQKDQDKEVIERYEQQIKEAEELADDINSEVI